MSSPRLLLMFLSLSLAPASAKGGLCERYKTLVFEGGGVRGVIYPGALIALHEAGLLQTVQNFAGTSAGSGTAALLALGFSACELREEVEEYSFHELVDFSLPKALRNAFFGIEAGTLFSKLAAKKGFFSGDKLERKFDMIIQRKLCSKALGLSTVRELPANSIHLAENGDCAKYKQATFASALDGNIELKLTGFDITHGRLRWFSRESTPNMPISKAIRISSGIPFIFEPVEYEGALYLDGGVLRNLPVSMNIQPYFHTYNHF
jgi:NTE family protein